MAPFRRRSTRERRSRSSTSVSDMPILTPEGRMPQSISDDVIAIEAALADLSNAPADAPFDSITTRYHKRTARNVARMRVEAACDPARLRRVLDAMQAMGEALKGLMVAMENSGGEHVTGREGSE